MLTTPAGGGKRVALEADLCVRGLEPPPLAPAIAEERANNSGCGLLDFLSVPMPLREEDAMCPKFLEEERSLAVSGLSEGVEEGVVGSDAASGEEATIEDAMASSLRGKDSP